MGRKKASRDRDTVEQMALKAINTPKTFAQRRIMQRMARTYGWKSTNRALQNMNQMLEICDPNHTSRL